MLDFIIFPNNPYHVFLVKEINTKKNYIVFEDEQNRTYRNSITAISEKLSLLNEDLVSSYLNDYSCIFIKKNIKYVREDYRQKVKDRIREILM